MPTLHPAWTPAANAASFLVRSGQVSGQYTQSNAVAGANTTEAIISVPALGWWYWVVAGIDANGTEGAWSQEVLEQAAADPVTAPNWSIVLSLA